MKTLSSRNRLQVWLKSLESTWLAAATSLLVSATPTPRATSPEVLMSLVVVVLQLDVRSEAAAGGRQDRKGEEDA